MVEIRIIPYFAVIEIENEKKAKMMEKLITSQTVSETEKAFCQSREKKIKRMGHTKNTDLKVVTVEFHSQKFRLK
jgi:hypothetical protein